MTYPVFHKLNIVQHLCVRPRLTLSALVILGVFFYLPEQWRTVTKLLTAWDLGTLLYLVLVAIMMIQSDHISIRKRAAAQDEGSLIILGLTVLSAVASLVAIMTELAAVKDQSDASMLHVILSGMTVVLSWLFMQTMFALHYAHEFYNRDSKHNEGGLVFPGEGSKPDYWDFIYFSFVIGTAAQTADINITSKTFRRIVALHCVIVFFFNTTILALTVNVGAGLL